MIIPLKKMKKVAYILGTGDLLPLDLPEVLPGFGPDHHLATLLGTSRAGIILKYLRIIPNTTAIIPYKRRIIPKKNGGSFLKQRRIIAKTTEDNS